MFLYIVSKVQIHINYLWPSSKQASAIAEEGDEEEEATVMNPFAFGSGDLLGSGDDAVLGDDGVEGELGSGNFTLGEDDEEDEEEDVSCQVIHPLSEFTSMTALWDGWMFVSRYIGQGLILPLLLSQTNN